MVKAEISEDGNSIIIQSKDASAKYGPEVIGGGLTLQIGDTDMAKEMMNYTKMNVLVQSAQAMLAQANRQPQSVLQLLQ